MTSAIGDSARFCIIVDPISLTRSARGQTTGVIYALLDDHPFPEAQWSDLIVPVLHGWTADLLGFCRGNGDAVQLHFMDGPYTLEIRRQQLGKCRISCVRGRNAVEYVGESLPFRDVIAAFGDAAAAVIDECDRRGWTSRDIVELRLARTALSDFSAAR